MSDSTAQALEELARSIDTIRAQKLANGLDKGLSERARAVSLVLSTALPATGSYLLSSPKEAENLANAGWLLPRTRHEYLERLGALLGYWAGPLLSLDGQSTLGWDEHTPMPKGVFESGAHGHDSSHHIQTDEQSVKKILRQFVNAERCRIGLREVLPISMGGADIGETGREISALAEACIEVAMREALISISKRFGAPKTRDGGPSQFVVLGMGKLGGDELNAGSDVDLMFIYDTDDGETESGETLHSYWSRVARRLTNTIEDVTADGLVWRVDLRLRPEGGQGPIANSFAAAERYYETWGRPWERAALLRARSIAGNISLGDELLSALAAFVFPRRVDPSIIDEMARLVERSRSQLSRNPDRDLKLGRGGIREVEFFTQSLQLIWGGQDIRVRTKNTLDALLMLRDRGFVTFREWDELSGAYLLFRRLEHRVQWSTGVQTHDLPTSLDELLRLARSLGYVDIEALNHDLESARQAVSLRFAGLRPDVRVSNPIDIAVSAAAHADNDSLIKALGLLNVISPTDMAKELMALARRPDYPFGSLTLEKYPLFGRSLLQGIVDAADPELSVRTLRSLFTRISDCELYIRPLEDEPQRVRRLAAVLGASVFVGTAVSNFPQLRDRVLFSKELPTPESIRKDFREIVHNAIETGLQDPEEFVGRLREAKVGWTVEVALADLGNSIKPQAAMRMLSTIADNTVEATIRFDDFRTGQTSSGLAVLGLGKLGGEELGYGADLDLVFLYDPQAAPEGKEPTEYFARKAQRIVRWISTPHAQGAGYEVDTRLRPSGSQGMLVTSLESFARYHDSKALESNRNRAAAFWERMALIRARFVGGDSEVAKKAMVIAHSAAYEGNPPAPEELYGLRTKTEQEVGPPKAGRIHLKAGRGGILDVEFAIQYLQMKHGKDHRIRTSNTEKAIRALVAGGYLPSDIAASLREGYRMLRRLENRIRIVHGNSTNYIDASAEGLRLLARRMGFRDGPRGSAPEIMLARLGVMMDRVHQAYEKVVVLAKRWYTQAVNGSAQRKLAWVLLPGLIGSCEPLADDLDFDRQQVAVFQRSTPVPAPPNPSTLKVMTWNIKFGAARVDFWFDYWGDATEMSYGVVANNLENICTLIREVNPDILMTEEIAVNSRSSAYVDMVQYLMECSNLNEAAYFQTWNTRYLPAEGVGRVDQGNAIFSRYPIDFAERIKQPDRTDQDSLHELYYLHRMIGRAVIRTSESDKITAFVVHTEAYDRDGTKSRQIEQIYEEINKETQPFVVGGDFNELPPTAVKIQSFPDEHPDTIGTEFEQPPYTPEIMQKFYDKYNPAIALEDYGTTEASQRKYYSHSLIGPDKTGRDGKPGYWNRTLDYLFCSSRGDWQAGESDVLQTKGRQGIKSDPLWLSDHAPVVGRWGPWGR